MKRRKIKPHRLLLVFNFSHFLKRYIFFIIKSNQLLPLHVSVDIDALDPWYAPSTGTPVLGGLTLMELMQIGNEIHETGIN